MKTFTYKYLVMTLIIITLLSCSKKEDVLTEAPQEEELIKATFDYTIPLGTANQGGTLTVNLNLPSLTYPEAPYDEDDDGRPGVYPLIEFATQQYLKETCLLDISKLKAGSYYEQIGNKDFYVAFFNNDKGKTSVQKLDAKKTAPYGWNCEWNINPFVEKKYPEVLFNPIDYGDITIILSKPCTEFGFELTPNIRGKNVNFSAVFGFIRYGIIQPLTTYNPGGARIFGMSSVPPFNIVKISLNTDPNQVGYSPGGLAIANIRYKLAK